MATHRDVLDKSPEHAFAMDMPGEAQPFVVRHQLRYRTIQCDFATPQLGGKCKQIGGRNTTGFALQIV